MTKQDQPRQYSVQEEQQLAQEAQQRGMTVEEVKSQREQERKDITSQGTTETNN